MTHFVQRKITEDEAITFSGLPPLLATPFLVWLLEESAMELINPYLENDELTLGTQVDIEHLAAAQVGEEITFTATLVSCADREFLFRVQATNGRQIISKGLHRRRLVSQKKLVKRLSTRSD